MIDNGIELYAEADKMQQTANVLISFCRPPNEEALRQAKKALLLTIEAVQKLLLLACEQHPHAEPKIRLTEVSDFQKRYNYTRSAIRDEAKKARKRLVDLEKNIWRG